MLTSHHGHFVAVTYIGVHAHEGEIRDLVLGLKYAKARGNAHQLASALVIALPFLTSGSHCITWAPTTTEHIRERGMDHAELIARHVGAITHRPVHKLLRRTSAVSQTGFGRTERLTRPQFVAKPLGRHRNIVVIDDVVTTGATFRAATQALINAGAESVVCCAPSRTR
jgi:predicted amidophosphoribosyltransferase